VRRVQFADGSELGIIAVLAYTVAQQRRKIGVRVALGEIRDGLRARAAEQRHAGARILARV
jgi:hypothetical protein